MANELGIYNGTALVFTHDNKINLTDMWRAADGRSSQRPANWLQHDETQKFLESLKKQSNVFQDYIETKRGGTNPGTWGHYQIALAYAKYLSPEFHIWCNEVVKERIETQGIPKEVKGIIPDFTNPVESARAWADAMEAKQELIELREADSYKVKAHDTYIETPGRLLPSKVMQSCGIKAYLGIKWLRDCGYIYKDHLGRNFPYQKYIGAGLFVIDIYTCVSKGVTKKFPITYVTPKGVDWILSKKSEMPPRYWADKHYLYKGEK